MLPIQSFAGGVLAEIIRRQPASKERTAFAWQVAAGPTLARTATVELAAGVLSVRARDARWAREIERGSETILKRMQHLLGPASITRLEIRGHSPFSSDPVERR
jgi:predicted nucleic acid-binding Zn ribbon protein